MGRRQSRDNTHTDTDTHTHPMVEKEGNAGNDPWSCPEGTRMVVLVAELASERAWPGKRSDSLPLPNQE